MQKLILPVASLFVLATFLLIALATSGSSNTTVAPDECAPYGFPISISTVAAHVYFHNKNGQPVAGATGQLFISRQEIQDTTDCTYLIVYIQTLNIVTDATGYYMHQRAGASNYSDGDLWRMEVNIPAKPGVNEGFRQTLVVNGFDDSAVFSFTNPNPL